MRRGYSAGNFRILRKIVLVVLFAAITYILGLIPAFYPGFIPVPIVLQSLGAGLAASVIGPSAALSMLLFLALAAAGLPMLTGGVGGIAVFAGPTAGFLAGWVITAFVVGGLVKSGWYRLSFFKLFLFNLLGILVMYIPGIAWLSFSARLSLVEAAVASAVFIPLDVAKAVAASFIGMLFRQYYPLIDVSERRRQPHITRPMRNISPNTTTEAASTEDF